MVLKFFGHQKEKGFTLSSANGQTGFTLSKAKGQTGFTLSSANGQTGFTLSKANGQTGFTLIEILVVFSIITILSGIGIASFASYSRNQQLNQTANNIKLLVNEARFNALSGVKTNKDPSGSTVTCGNESFEGYNVTVIGNDQVRLSLQCANIGSLTTKDLTMPKGYAIGNGTTCVEIHFDSLSSTGVGIPCRIVITGYNQEKIISVDAVGNTSVQ